MTLCVVGTHPSREERCALLLLRVSRRLAVAHPLQQVGPEYGHEDEDAEEAQAADEQQDLRQVRPQPVALEGVLRRRSVRRLQELRRGGAGSRTERAANIVEGENALDISCRQKMPPCR